MIEDPSFDPEQRHTGSASKPLPKIYCKGCYFVQAYRGQDKCIHCQKKLSAWHVKSQLRKSK